LRYIVPFQRLEKRQFDLRPIGNGPERDLLSLTLGPKASTETWVHCAPRGDDFDRRRQ
jgi:hypothetical protein